MSVYVSMCMTVHVPQVYKASCMATHLCPRPMLVRRSYFASMPGCTLPHRFCYRLTVQQAGENSYFFVFVLIQSHEPVFVCVCARVSVCV